MSSPLWMPGRIGALTLRNRIVLTGHGTGMVVGEGASDAQAGRQLIDYYAERARGGVGLIMLGTQQVHPSSPGLGHLLVNYDDSAIPGLRRIADAVHAQGARIFGYLGHFGAQAPGATDAPWTATAFWDELQGRTTHAMSASEIADVVAAHADAAERNLRAGMDGIEVHCGHGLLLHQFLSPWTNHRTDRYGGTLEGRLRFPCEVLAAVRRRIGAEVPLGIRLSGTEDVPGGLTVEDMAIIVPRLVDAGALDYVDVSAGNDRDRVSNMRHHPPMGLAVAPYAAVAHRLRTVLTIPVIHGTRIDSQDTAENLLASGTADFAGMCRALIADPHLPNRIRDAQADLANPCVACEQACIGHLHQGQPISCVGNPITGRETEWRAFAQAAAMKHIVVVGAGPAGMEAAWVAARRGHRVTLIERNAEVGGQLHVAASAPGRDGWRALIAHRARRLSAMSDRIALKLGVAADVDTVVALAPDVVVMACGAEPHTGIFTAVAEDVAAYVAEAPSGGGDRTGSARAPVIVQSHVAALTDPALRIVSGQSESAASRSGTVDNERAARRPHAIVIDRNHHQQGIAVACFLAERGMDVTIVSAGTRVGWRLDHANFTLAQQRMRACGVTQKVDLQALRIIGHQLLCRDVFSRDTVRLDAADRIVTVEPGIPRQEWVPSLRAALPDVPLHLIGDCRLPRDIEAAILEGHRVGRAL
ncbi:FAD-dependent oxidoreductase [Robbsia sp. KACC 23696]|uniref:FAD-dependent oxidoreductase n=1 Tax=Robbsia sp. KACC 23696 TaxID=3149231 RepID=UPI00325AFC2F